MRVRHKAKSQLWGSQGGAICHLGVEYTGATRLFKIHAVRFRTAGGTFTRTVLGMVSLASDLALHRKPLEVLNMKLSGLFSILFIAAISSPAIAQNGTPSLGRGVSPSDTEISHSSPELEKRNPRYQLRKSDSFGLEFEFSPELNQTVSVQPDGYITLKAVGTIFAQGLTVPELTEKIQLAYTGILHDPIVTIELKDFDKPYFIASGQVGKPGKYDLRSDLTVTQAVAVAGGFTEASKHSQVVLYRPSENGITEARLIDVKKMLKSRDLAEDIHLQPGDMIFVPQNWISKIARYLPTSTLGLYGNPVY